MPTPGSRRQLPVLLIRPAGNQADVAALNAIGQPSWVDPYLTVQPVSEASGAHELLGCLDPVIRGWVLLTSQRALPSWEHLVGTEELHRRLRTCAASGWRLGLIGPGTAASVPDLGWASPLVPQRATAAELAGALLQASPPSRAVIPQSTIALGVLAETLGGAGWDVRARAVYQTTPVAHTPASASAVIRGEVSAVVLRSPSAARALFHFGPPAREILLVAAGSTTAAAVAELGRKPVLAETPNPRDVAAAVAASLGVS